MVKQLGNFNLKYMGIYLQPTFGLRLEMTYFFQQNSRVALYNL